MRVDESAVHPGQRPQVHLGLGLIRDHVGLHAGLQGVGTHREVSRRVKVPSQPGIRHCYFVDGGVDPVGVGKALFEVAGQLQGRQQTPPLIGDGDR